MVLFNFIKGVQAGVERGGFKPYLEHLRFRVFRFESGYPFVVIAKIAIGYFLEGPMADLRSSNQAPF